MATALSSKARELIQRPVIASVATVDAKGSPQVTPVWIDIEGDDLVFNTTKGRVKTANLEHNPHVAVSIVDPDNMYNVVVVRGTVEETEERCRRAHQRSAQEVSQRRHLSNAHARCGPGQIRIHA
jgi:PPOX class probable F420-dependent enzyme